MFTRKLLKNSLAALTQVFPFSQQLISRSFLFLEMATESCRSLYLSCFALLFCRIQHGVVPKCALHVQLAAIFPHC